MILDRKLRGHYEVSRKKWGDNVSNGGVDLVREEGGRQDRRDWKRGT